ncbi:MAG: hypothetical protein U1F43_07210 [Myxococcota bacterium]
MSHDPTPSQLAMGEPDYELMDLGPAPSHGGRRRRPAVITLPVTPAVLRELAKALGAVGRGPRAPE